MLIVDEAHIWTWNLEEVRLLTNLETPQQKLLQIVLVGQPELDLKVDSSDLRQLKQRIALRCQLEPLQEEETRGVHPAEVRPCGSELPRSRMFPKETIASVYRYSKGIPRLINTVCENALIAAYAAEAQTIRPEVVDEVAKDLR